MDKYKIIKKQHTYLCQWIPSNGTIYTKNLPQRELFPYNLPKVIQHNTNLIITYYTKKQHKLYENIMNKNDTFTQNKDARHISPPINIPLVKISIHECNP